MGKFSKTSVMEYRGLGFDGLIIEKDKLIIWTLTKKVEIPYDNLAGIESNVWKGLVIETKGGEKYKIKLGGWRTEEKAIELINKLREGNKNSVKETPASVADEIKKLKELLDEEVISKEEFEKQKQKLLN